MTRPKLLTAEEERTLRLEEASLVLVTSPTSPSVSAALLIHRGEVLTYAPGLERWIGRRTAGEVLDFFRKQGWRVEVNPTPR